MTAAQTRRQAKVEVALELFAQGLTSYEVADRMGINYRTANEYRRDPTGERKREQQRVMGHVRRSGVCTVCGGPTNLSRGAARPPQMCQWCRRGLRNPALPETGEGRRYVALTDVPLADRLKAAREACACTDDEHERWELLAYALWPTRDVHGVLDDAEVAA